MALIDRELAAVWDALRSQSTQRDHALTEVRLRYLRGIRNLSVPFSYPVCVLAGPNGCGKSTVLFACACAYQVPGSGPRDYVPTSLFPNFTGGGTGLQDTPEKTEIEFHYLANGERSSMIWRRNKSWNRSFMGRKNGRQPERQLYLRTLANLASPSEVRSLLQLARQDLNTEQISADLLIFAHRVMPHRYRSLARIASHSKDLLFAVREGGSEARYSEFHMSAGERAILHISKDISGLNDALILIDEVDTGLHPYTQQQAMLELQRIALRNRLQVVVTSHSPVVLDSVPPEARIFLDRDDDTAEVHRVNLYRDILQKALYGQSRDRLSILCEDEVAEGLIHGFMDVLNAQIGLRHDDYIIGRDTGRNEFSGHIRMLGKFGKLSDLLPILDGDSRNLEPMLKSTAAQYGQAIQPLFLPGSGPPEAWIWQTLERQRDDYAALLGIAPGALEHRMRAIIQLLGGAVHQQDTHKAALEAFANEINRTVPEIARIVGQQEAQHSQGPAAVFLAELAEQINVWRQV